MWKRLVFLLLVGVWLAPWPDLIPKGKRFPVGVWPAWERVKNRKDAADFATYYYATQVAFAGGDPYRTKSLSRAARKDLTRKSVHPYFYPPPFVLGMAWTQPLDLKTAYHAWFWFNQLCLLATLWIFWKWFRAGPLLLAFLGLTFTPFVDNIRMGQANLPVMMLAIVGLWHTRGLWVSAAAMCKMSPALLLGWWSGRGMFQPVIVACVGAVAFSLAALPLIGWEAQWAFYTEILPKFSNGQYHGLSVPITLPANHSIADLFNQYWPGPDKHSLDPLAKKWTSIVALGLLMLIVLVGHRRRDPLGEACIAGALVVLLVITPVYTYEHHLAMLALPLAAAGAALTQGRLQRWWWPILLVGYWWLAWPLVWLRSVQDSFPDLHWFLQESKFFGEGILLLACLAGAVRSPKAPT